ncbi:lipopolysaccharide-induced tumor necrosis factor-alpha factor homolog [Lucilia cuprina]|uniref:lipopolysaccharide-induced tumor necrosis factor-alpha factor homolog n=1 Tax=Lucilia cuprina TaxID=7375 RepID=UPI001F0674D6|nr:lipopolysaccharide-induced tumor necrosis factor-alpha factor homolog [Lucilia cuprina]
MNTVQNGPLIYRNYLQPMASAPFEGQNIEQQEIAKMRIYKETSECNNYSMASAPSVTPAQTILMEQTIISYQPVGPKSTSMICPFCRSNIKTLVEHSPSIGTHILGILLFSFCCCCLPYFTNSCRSVQHTCPNCQAFIGNYSS